MSPLREQHGAPAIGTPIGWSIEIFEAVYNWRRNKPTQRQLLERHGSGETNALISAALILKWS